MGTTPGFQTLWWQFFSGTFPIVLGCTADTLVLFQHADSYSTSVDVNGDVPVIGLSGIKNCTSLGKKTIWCWLKSCFPCALFCPKTCGFLMFPIKDDPFWMPGSPILGHPNLMLVMSTSNPSWTNQEVVSPRFDRAQEALRSDPNRGSDMGYVTMGWQTRWEPGIFRTSWILGPST